MARTINQIQTEILLKKQQASELDALEVLTDDEKSSILNLTSTSKVAIWRLWVYIVAVSIWVLETVFDMFKSEITALVVANRPHTQEWYKQKALAFQYGDNLIDSDEYLVIDEDKRIIKQVAVLEGDRKIIIKIATVVGGELKPLPDIDQINAFASYMNKVKDAGSVIEIVNEGADLLRVEIDYYYNPLVVDSNGLVIENPTESIVKIAIENYLNSLDFDGEFDINKMVDYIQKSIGFVSLKLNFCGFKAGLSTSFSSIMRQYKPLSGYMKLEELQVNYNAVV